ncbi:MAG: hypothetical protein HQL57_07655 [Magnetococcales bacterium]|nr:hypothetical protein [Magnetococcales bacterium]MBF0157040.1 hypothetical protein [Magnetococcales bacterium]
MPSIEAVSIFVLFTISLHGWGRSAVSVFYGNEKSPGYVYPVAVGFAVWVFIGGVLNLAGLAHGGVVDGLVMLGVAMAGWMWWRTWVGRRGGSGFSDGHRNIRDYLDLYGGGSRYILLISLFVVVVSSVFLFHFLMPMKSFNFHDDFQFYFNQVKIMAEMGSLQGQPLFRTGLINLGGFTFVQVFFVDHLSFAHIGSVDAVLFFSIGMLLIIDVGIVRFARPLAILGAVVVFLMVNPQIVNVSPVYAGAVTIIGLIHSSIILFETMADASFRRQLLAAVPVGLFVGAMLPLKLTYFLFIVTFVTLQVLVFIFRKRPWRQGLRVVSIGAGVALLETLLWAMAYWENFAAMLVAPAVAPPVSSGVAAGLPGAMSVRSPIDLVVSNFRFLMSGVPLPYGDNPFQFTVIALLLPGIALYFWRRCDAGEELDRGDATRWVLLVSCVSALVAFLFAGPVYGYAASGIRYSTPFLLGVLPLAVVLASIPGGGLHGVAPSVAGGGIPGGHGGSVDLFPMLVSVVVVLLFIDTFILRIFRVVDFAHVYSFQVASSSSYIESIDGILGPDNERLMRRVQEHVPPGRTIMVDTVASFLFDFNRNHLLVSDYGLAKFRIGIYGSDSWIDLQKHIQGMGADYMIWQFRGFGFRGVSYFEGLKRMEEFSRFGEGIDLNISFLRGVDDMAGRNESVVVGDYLVIKLSADAVTQM